MADPKKPDDKQAEPAPAAAPQPQQFTSTGAPVDDRFSYPQPEGGPMHLKNAETEAAAQQAVAEQQKPKSAKEAKAEEEDEDKHKGSKQHR